MLIFLKPCYTCQYRVWLLSMGVEIETKINCWSWSWFHSFLTHHHRHYLNSPSWNSSTSGAPPFYEGCGPVDGGEGGTRGLNQEMGGPSSVSFFFLPSFFNLTVNKLNKLEQKKDDPQAPEHQPLARTWHPQGPQNQPWAHRQAPQE